MACLKLPTAKQALVDNQAYVGSSIIMWQKRFNNFK